MTKNAIIPANVPKTYAELRRRVEETLLQGQRAIEHAKLLTYHETGRLINAHLLVNGARADYGAQVIQKLARDLNIARTTLYQCCQFADYFPIVRARGQLTWAYYRALCQVADDGERNALLAQMLKNDWTSAELEEQVRVINATSVEPREPKGGAEPAELLKPNRGTPGVYRVTKVDGALVVDLGFAFYLDLPSDTDFEPGALVSVDAAGRVAAAPEATKADLFNYRVEIIKVVDGDTLWVKIYLRPRQWLKQKLRLRGLDCPELKTPEGKAAKRFVDALVARTATVVINTTKPDKYDRYLADVFLVGATDQSSEASAKEDIFLNNALLANGQAVRKEAWQFGDWEPELVR